MSVYFMESMNTRRKPSQHRVLMNFMQRNGYRISFLEQDCKTTLPLELTFAEPDKIIEMQVRWGEDKSSAAVKETERQLTIGRPGSVWLLLSPEDYSKLHRKRKG